MVSSAFETIFRERLLLWAAGIHRPMPWKGEKNPYLVWLSEIILQQTRVEQGLPYFEKFKAAYPRVEDLAAAPPDEVMKLWEGLGYYSRARNLQAAAQVVSQQWNGQFPTRYEELLRLPGVGPYTAAAIASFAFGLPHAVLDGNVFRILARISGSDTPIDTTPGKKFFSALAEQLLDKERPAHYNQAIMDFGALQCVPKNPDCPRCPFVDSCVAYQSSTVEQLPVKAKKLVRKDRYFHYFVFQWENQLLIQKRTDKDIWQELYEFPLIETAQLDYTGWQASGLWQDLGLPGSLPVQRTAGPFRQQLTHQRIIGIFREFRLAKTPFPLPDAYLVINRKNLSKFAFPKLIDCYLRDISLNLFE
ncbi:MAG: A/G-specific adenine glycosylase [Lewinella sp.]|nr:A/G-specific adenine glycosylase [Lewinella sp.]